MTAELIQLNIQTLFCIAFWIISLVWKGLIYRCDLWLVGWYFVGWQDESLPIWVGLGFISLSHSFFSLLLSGRSPGITVPLLTSTLNLNSIENRSHWLHKYCFGRTTLRVWNITRNNKSILKRRSVDYLKRTNYSKVSRKFYHNQAAVQ